MTISSSSFAVGVDVKSLSDSIAAQIALGFQPADNPIQMHNLLIQRCDKVTSSQVLAAGDGAIAVAQGTVIITKGSAAALTLAAPTTAQAGTRITITSSTAFAHVITATGLLENGTTGGPHNTATFAAFPGATITLEAYNGLWFLVSSVLVTIA
jgi:hypothetical protein